MTYGVEYPWSNLGDWALWPNLRFATRKEAQEFCDANDRDVCGAVPRPVEVDE